MISLGSLVGFLTVFGIAARNGTMLISHCQQLEREEGQPFGPSWCCAASERLVPNLMTLQTTGLAPSPLIGTGSVPGQERAPDGRDNRQWARHGDVAHLFVVPSPHLRFAQLRQRPSIA